LQGHHKSELPEQYFGLVVDEISPLFLHAKVIKQDSLNLPIQSSSFPCALISSYVQQ